MPATSPTAIVFAERAGLRGVLYRVDRGDDLRAQLAAVGVAVRAT